MINTLALFSPKEKLKLSCYALEELDLLCPYFCLQGFVTVIVSSSLIDYLFTVFLSLLSLLLKENPDELHTVLDADFLFKKNSPCTIVDLSFKQVIRTPILNEFTLAK